MHERTGDGGTVKKNKVRVVGASAAWSHHVGDPVLESNLTRRVDVARFMVEVLEDEGLAHHAPAVVGRLSSSARAHATASA